MTSDLRDARNLSNLVRDHTLEPEVSLVTCGPSPCGCLLPPCAATCSSLEPQEMRPGDCVNFPRSYPWGLFPSISVILSLPFLKPSFLSQPWACSIHSVFTLLLALTVFLLLVPHLLQPQTCCSGRINVPVPATPIFCQPSPGVTFLSL